MGEWPCHGTFLGDRSSADSVQDVYKRQGYYDSMYGRIESGWEIENEIIRYTFNIPGNTSALLYLPASSVKDVKDNGKGILKKSTGIKFIGENN